jgi:hypothetical protein
MGRVNARRVGASRRALPDFLIIGTQLGGTSSLYRYLGAHPDVAPSLRKETEYFSTEFHRGEGWYRAHFPWRSTADGKPARQTFEATPAYLLDPLAAPRAAELIPNARIIVMLRDPVDRAFSQYGHNRRLGAETHTFEEAIAAEPVRLRGEYDRTAEDENYEAIPLRRFGYVERGLYAEQLERWLDRFDDVHVIRSEDFMRDPRPVYRSVLDFLDLSAWEPDAFRNYSYRDPQQRTDSKMPSAVRRDLEVAFAAPNSRLNELLQRDFSWSS